MAYWYIIQMKFVLNLTIEIEGLIKQFRSRSDATERGIWLETTLFTTQPALIWTNQQDVKRMSLKV